MGDDDLRGEVGAFARQALMELGYRAAWVEDAQAALAGIEASAPRYEVVFSDVAMPGMNGVDPAREIRRRPCLPVVLTSGYSRILASEGADGCPLLGSPTRSPTSAEPRAGRSGSVRGRLPADPGSPQRNTPSETASARRPVR